MPWLRLIRWKNLLIVFLTQFLAWYCVLVPIRKHTGHDLLLDGLNKVSSNIAFMKFNGTLDYFATLPVYRSALVLATVLPTWPGVSGKV